LITSRLADLAALRMPHVPSDVYHAQYKFYAYLKPEALKAGWSRDRIVAAVNERGMPLFSGSCSEIYLERAFAGTGWVPAERLPVARELGETSLMFLVHPTLTEEYLHQVCDIVREVVSEATLN
jgi:dTDP-4-amino-4,6-dideoxygalactose transaminase